MSKCDECGITPAYEGGVFCTKCKPQTNADRIRGMTDEELSNALAHKADACRNCSSDSLDICKDCWTDWLKQEVT